jgi:hypothetical protein
LLGNHQEAPPTEAAWRALEEVLVFLHRRYEIDPRASIDFARSTDLWRYDLPTLPGHRDCTPTECPGDYVYQRLPALRARVAERINGGAPTPLAIIQSPPTRNIWLGTASYRWERAAPYDCVFEGFWKHPGEDPVDYLRGYDEQAMPEHIVTRQTEASFDLREPGQYTLHLRPAGQSFADRVTVVVDRHVVRDNADLEGVHRTEGWTRSQSVKEFYGSDYEVAVAGSGAEFSWQLPVPESGPYRVQACWASAPEHTRTAAYAVAADGEVLDTITVNQSLRGAVWTTLGTFDFVAGQTCEVTLTAPAADEEYIVVADAVRIVMEV